MIFACNIKIGRIIEQAIGRAELLKAALKRAREEEEEEEEENTEADLEGYHLRNKSASRKERFQV